MSNNGAFAITANALAKKRAEVLFELDRAEKRVERFRADLGHIEAVLRMFRPDFKAENLPVIQRRPVKSPHFKRGDISERIYNALRLSGAVTSLELATAAMRDKGLDAENDAEIRSDFIHRFRLQLNTMRRAGTVERFDMGNEVHWRLVSAT